jgi:hypothetical protein
VETPTLAASSQLWQLPNMQQQALLAVPATAQAESNPKKTYCMLKSSEPDQHVHTPPAHQLQPAFNAPYTCA